jgi:hypothetical protein
VIVDGETFTELTVHLKRASDSLLRAAQDFMVLVTENASEDGSSDDRWAQALGEVMAMATEMVAMEHILRALTEANREEEGAPREVSEKKFAGLR